MSLVYHICFIIIINSIFCKGHYFCKDEDVEITNIRGNGITIHCKNPYVLSNFTSPNGKIALNIFGFELLECNLTENFRISKVSHSLGFSNVYNLLLNNSLSMLKRNQLNGLENLNYLSIYSYDFEYLESDLLQNLTKLIN